MNPRTTTGLGALAAYALLIAAANWAISRYGFLPVGFGLLAPAGTYFAGAVLVARDLIQITFGRWWVLPAIAAGCVLSWFVAPAFAVASTVAFGAGELADWAIFTPLIDRGRILTSLLAANTVGLLADTLIFLQLAFGTVAAWDGTALGKLWMTLAAVPFRFLVRRRLTAWTTG